MNLEVGRRPPFSFPRGQFREILILLCFLDLRNHITMRPSLRDLLLHRYHLNIVAGIIIIATAKPSTAKFTIFEPNCSQPGSPSPPTSANLVLGPDIRSTFEILWSSIFTLLICCWSVLHLNIPSQVSRPNKTPFQKIKNEFRVVWPKVQWMILTIMLPEFLVAKALQDWHLARRSVKDMQRVAERDGVEWTVTHGFYADMGGFVISGNPNLDDDEEEEKRVSQPIVLNLPSLRYAITDGGLISALPAITQEEIMDKSKEDFFVKAISGIQLLWSASQVITRAIRGLAIAQMEIAVIAYAACTLITLFLCLEKPKDVWKATAIPLRKEADGKDVEVKEFHCKEIQRLRPHSWFLRFRHFTKERYLRGQTLSSPIPNGALYSHDVMNYGGTLSGAVFGGIHCAAWNYEFPSYEERVLWRVASVCTAGIPLLFYALSLVNLRIQKFGGLKKGVEVLETVVGLCYLAARVFLVVEVFRSLFFLPTSAFVNTWTVDFPHVS